MAAKTVYLGLGSNVGDREAWLRFAVQQLPLAGVRVVKASSLYETEPMYLREQAAFLNMVVQGETELFPRQLLFKMQDVERQAGRKRSVANGPRTLDVDILLYGRFSLSLPGLTVPHPKLLERRFALQPLLEITPDLRHPVSRRPLRDALAEVGEQRVRVVSGVDWLAGVQQSV